jgi:hypothetical protein
MRAFCVRSEAPVKAHEERCHEDQRDGLTSEEIRSTLCDLKISDGRQDAVACRKVFDRCTRGAMNRRRRFLHAEVSSGNAIDGGVIGKAEPVPWHVLSRQPHEIFTGVRRFTVTVSAERTGQVFDGVCHRPALLSGRGRYRCGDAEGNHIDGWSRACQNLRIFMNRDAIGGQPPMNKEHLLAEVEDLLRTAPDRKDFNPWTDESGAWIGRASAILNRWKPSHSLTIQSARDATVSVDFLLSNKNLDGYSRLLAMLREARADLRLDVGPLSVLVQPGQVFDYFDELRKVIEPARSDIFFVDPYLDAEFVSRYLPFVAMGTGVRLLGNQRMTTLVPAASAFAKQSGLGIQVRSSSTLHDRYLFVDRIACYVSGASFKDGAKKSPVVLTQIMDAFQATWDTYDAIWAKSKVEL